MREQTGKHVVLQSSVDLPSRREPVAVLTQVEKTYHLDSVSVPVIKGVDIVVRRACFTVLMGPVSYTHLTLPTIYSV